MKIKMKIAIIIIIIALIISGLVITLNKYNNNKLLPYETSLEDQFAEKGVPGLEEEYTGPNSENPIVPSNY